MNKLKFAIIGCGRIAARHAEQINRVAELKAVCDKVESKAVLLGNKYGAKVYSDYNEMLLNEKELDMVAICTPNGLHAEHTIKAFRNGFHVLCEKPMACLLYTSPSPRDGLLSRMPSS